MTNFPQVNRRAVQNETEANRVRSELRWPPATVLINKTHAASSTTSAPPISQYLIEQHSLMEPIKTIGTFEQQEEV